MARRLSIAHARAGFRGRPLRFRLTAAFASVVALVLFATGVLIFVQFARDLDHRTDDELADRQTVVVGLSRGSVPTRVIELSGEPFSQIYDRAGRVVASSQRLAGAPILSTAELRRARTKPLAVTHENLPTTSDGGRVRAFPIAHGEVAAIVEPLDDRELSLKRLALLLALILPGALILASVAGHQVARGALMPVERMRARAAGIGAGESSRRLPEPGTNDELDRLAITLNELLGRHDSALVRERRIVGDASHELRTPIAVLSTRIDVALRGDDDPARLRKVLVETRADATRLSRLADDLLVLARADQGELPLRPEPLDVQDLLEHAAARHGGVGGVGGVGGLGAGGAGGEGAGGEGAGGVGAGGVGGGGVGGGRTLGEQRFLTIDNRIEGGAVVFADPDRTAQALDNLIINALRYGAGPVELRAQSADEGAVELSVRDHGSGFPPEFLPIAFERFSQADAAHGGAGSGLGLAIVDALARAQGGRATVANDPNGGAVGAITLPLA